MYLLLLQTVSTHCVKEVPSLHLTRHPLPNQLKLMLFPKMAELISDIQ